MTPVLTREQVRLYDRLATERYGIPPLLLMENAGRSAAEIVDRTYGSGAKAFVCCGTGNNGGDGCVIARHLHNAGWDVRLLLIGDPSRMTPEAHVHFSIVRLMALELTVTDDLEVLQAAARSIGAEEAVVDALLGTGFQGEVRRPTADLIHTLNVVSKRATVAVDLPSGLDCDTGMPASATIRADLTITFVAAKQGFLAPAAVTYTGRVEVADIGAPRRLLDELLASA